MNLDKVFQLGLYTAVLSLTLNSGCAQEDTQFVSRKITIEEKIYNYQVFVPQNWESKEKWPVVVFLHGAGERGEDGIKFGLSWVATWPLSAR